VPHDQWYLDGGKFDSVRVINRWKEKLDSALARGYAGMRVHGDETWLTDKAWKTFLEYEQSLNDALAHQRMIVLCTYPLSARNASEIFDVAHAHQVAIAKRHGQWEMLETPEIKQTKTELAELKIDLERQVHQRTSELAAVNQQLQETRRKLEEAQRIAHVGHWERDLETDAVTWSAEVYRIFGLPPQDRPMSFQEFLKRVHPEDQARVAHSVAEAVRNHQHYAVEYKIMRVDGEQRFVHSEGEVLRDKLGRPLRAFGTLQDITERREAENILRQSESQLRLVIDTIPTMAWIVLPGGGLDFINQPWLEYTGLSFEGAIKEPTRTIHPDDLPRVKEKWSVNMVSGEPYEDEMRLRRADGQYRWFLVRTVPLRDEHGNVIRWYGTSTDIEDRKRAEEALRETQAVLARVTRATVVGELTASIAHEVNQPLGAVVNNANAALRWLDGKPPNLDETQEALQRIVRDGNRASEVVARIRALLKDGTPIKTRFNLGEVIAEIVALTEAEAQRRQVSVQTRMESNLPRVTADRVQVQQVLMNLMMNALDALEEVIDRPGILTIRAGSDSPNSVHVAVQDTGIGVDRHQADRLFQAFFTTKPHGLGMGLAISRSIIEAHGGRLWMTPNDGPGVTFQFALPVQNGGAT
jgi:PAS domain S-box-containing protein